MIVDGVRAVRARIADACRRCGRPPESVRLIGVAKGRSAAQVAELIAAGVTDVGENYIQEAQAQRASLGARCPRVRWHAIGHLQRNKVRPALASFDVIHTVDSPALATALDRQLALASTGSRQPLDVLVQVNVSGETTKSGVSPSAAPALVEAVRRLPRLRLIGCMTMAPVVETPAAARACFEQLRRLRDTIDPALTELSMGMTDDFEAAIAEGSTMVRIGRAIFESREAACDK